MKILLLGDASHFHATLAVGLRQAGHHVDVASHGSGWMGTPRNFDIGRRHSRAGTVEFLCKLARVLPRLRGYDIVQFHNPIFLELRPERLYPILRYLKRHNGKLVYEALGNDPVFVKKCLDGSTFKYSEFRLGSEVAPYAAQFSHVEREWTAPEISRYHEYFLSQMHGIIACLWEYYHAYEGYAPIPLAYGGIPIDCDNLQPVAIDREPEKVRFFLGVNSVQTELKGRDILLASLQRVQREMPHAMEIDIVQNLPYDEYVRRMRGAHVILDQLYSYTPATNALLGMAQGIVAVSGGEPEYYDFIGEHTNRPIVNPSPLDVPGIDEAFRHIVQNKHLLPDMSRNSVAFANKYNNLHVVAERHLHFWNNL